MPCCQDSGLKVRVVAAMPVEGGVEIGLQFNSYLQKLQYAASGRFGGLEKLFCHLAFVSHGVHNEKYC